MQHHSCGVFAPSNPLRQAARRAILAPWFDASISACIFVNCLCLALRDPTAAACTYSDDAAMNGTLFALDILFTSIFLVELGLKLLVYGLVLHPGSYLRDGWNWIDGFVAITSFLGLLPGLCVHLSGLSALRAVRLLRTLRDFRPMRTFRATVQALIDAAPKLVHVAVLLLFIFVCFGILGVQLFMGLLRRRCHTLSSDGSTLMQGTMRAAPCGGENQCVTYGEAARLAGREPVYVPPPPEVWMEDRCEHVNTSAYSAGDVFCCVPTIPAASSAYYYNGAHDPRTANPDYGFTSFDHLPAAWLVVYRALTIEGWPDTMQLLVDAGTAPYWGISYMFILVLLCGWLAANLTLAVIYEQLHCYNVKAYAIEVEEARQRAADQEAEATFVQQFWEERSPSKAGTPLRLANGPAKGTIDTKPGTTVRPKWHTPSSNGRVDSMAKPHAAQADHGEARLSSRNPNTFVAWCERRCQDPRFNHFFIAAIVLNTAMQCIAYNRMPAALCQALDIIDFLFALLFTVEMVIKLVGLRPRGYAADIFNLIDGAIVVISWLSFVVRASLGEGFWVQECRPGLNPSILRTLRLVRLLNSIPSEPLRNLLAIVSAPSHLKATGALCFIFLLLLYTCTLLGTAYFGGKLDRCQQCTPLPRPLQLPIPYAGVAPNDTATGLGVGWEPYSTRSQAAGVSLCECDSQLGICLSPSGRAAETLAPAFLNAGLRSSAGGIAHGCFARPPRANFDDFGSALLTTFQVFTGEQWSFVMFQAMRSLGGATLLYFTLSLILGRFVVLNMYTAVILSFVRLIKPEELKLEKPERQAGHAVEKPHDDALSSSCVSITDPEPFDTERQLGFDDGDDGDESDSSIDSPPSPGRTPGRASPALPAVPLLQFSPEAPAAADAPSDADHGTEALQPRAARLPPPEVLTPSARSSPELPPGAPSPGILRHGNEADIASTRSSRGAKGVKFVVADRDSHPPITVSSSSAKASGGAPDCTALARSSSAPTEGFPQSQSSNNLSRSRTAPRTRTLSSRLQTLLPQPLIRRRSSAARNGETAESPSSSELMVEDRAALMLQARYRQHKAWMNVRAMRLVALEQQRLTQRGPSYADPLGVSRAVHDEGYSLSLSVTPAANPTRRWQPPKFSACTGVEADASMALGAFEEEEVREEHEGRPKLDFEFLEAHERQPTSIAELEATDEGDEEVARARAMQALHARTAATAFLSAGAMTRARRNIASPYEPPRKNSIVRIVSEVLWPRLRAHCQWLVGRKEWTAFVMVLIVGATVVLCMDEPALQRREGTDAERTRAALWALNLAFAILFTLEMLIKQIAVGLRAYFTSAWDVLDFCVVIISWATLTGDTSLAAFKSLRTLRALRSLRLAGRLPSMQLVIEALLRAFPDIFNVTLLLFVFFLVFAILGVQVFGGTLASCVLYVPPPFAGGSALLLPMTALSNRSICLAMGEALDAAGGSGSNEWHFDGFDTGTLCSPPVGLALPSNETRCRILWERTVSGFDHVGDALWTLAEVAMLQGWGRIMYTAMGARGPVDSVEQSPSPEAEPDSAFLTGCFFLIFVTIGGFVCIKLFAAVVIDKFNKVQDERSGVAFMSDAEKEWVETRRVIQTTRPLSRDQRPSNAVRRQAYVIITHVYFEYVVMAMIIGNVVLMGTSTHEQTVAKGESFSLADTIELAFSVFFLFEAALKLLALFPRAYFRVGWNCFDFFLCLVSIFDIITTFGTTSSNVSMPFNPTLLRLLRMARVARLIRLVRSAKGLRTLLFTIIECAPAFANIIGLLALCSLIFATMGMGLFGDVIAQPHLGYGGATGSGAWPSFETFGGAMTLMVMLLTSEHWPMIMRACTVQPPFCGTQAGVNDYDDCGPPYAVAVLFFGAYQLLGSLLMMNLVVGAIVEQFTATSIRENMVVPMTAIFEFQEEWHRLDPDGTHFISAHYLAPLLLRLLPPLGVKNEGGMPLRKARIAVLRRLEEAWLPVRAGKVQFQETLFALARVKAGQRLPACKRTDSLNKQMRRVLDLRDLKDAPVDWNAHEYFAAEMVQRTYRGFRAREALFATKQKQIRSERVTTAFHISSAVLSSFITTDADACSATLARGLSRGSSSSSFRMVHRE